MATVAWNAMEWAHQNFDGCDLGNRLRNERLVKIAVQQVAHPDGSIPQQSETWAASKAAYRFFDCEHVSFQKIIAPHCRWTRESCVPGEVRLIVCDTSEMDYTSLHKTNGLGPIGNGRGQGFFVHSALMIDPCHGTIEGLAAQEVFYRKAGKKKKSKDAQRKQADRESAVWGRVIDAVGRPPEGVTFKHVCDRGADDIEVMWRAKFNGCGFVIRVSHLQRKVVTADQRTMSVAEYLAELPAVGATREVEVQGTKKSPARTAVCTLRYGNVSIPLSKTLTPWLKEHRPDKPLQVGVVELREESPPPGCQAIRWILYTDNPITSEAEANQALGYYELRWTIEEYHKALKTGCAVEARQLQEADRLERAFAVSSIVAVRLLQLKTAARQTPERPARELVPPRWIKVLQTLRERPLNLDMTIRDFVRQLAGLGGFLGRKGDGEPGWITLWRGTEKFLLVLRAERVWRQN